MNKNKTLMLFILSLALLLKINIASGAATYVAKGATVISVASSFGPGDNFVVTTTGGTSSCQGKNIIFKSIHVANEAVHARGYSTALTAFASGSTVNIWSKDGTCEGAHHIHVTK